MSYRAPVPEIMAAMRAIAPDGPSRYVDMGTVEAILEEAGRFAAAKLAPLNRVGDRNGAALKNGRVSTPPGWAEAYHQWAEAGWNGIGAPTEFGGQDLPVLVQMGIQEIWNGANPAFAAGPMLIPGAVDAIRAHGDVQLQERYLSHLVSGRWMATMNLTEPQAGSDLGALAARAERAEDGTYRIFGQKIFISYGDHDLTDNIVHLVLARLPDAPPGTSGISMFLVPKMLPPADGGSATIDNDIAVAGVEEKLGLHGSPTCTMVYGGRGDGAIGWIVGEENQGLAAMFTMMNIARLSVGIQAVGVAGRSCQSALSYARERRQGRSPGAQPGTMAAIVEHPDVQRELLRMTTLTAASRLICYTCARAIDLERGASGDEGSRWADRASLLTPVAKAFSTDAVIEVTSTAIQVHGGAGYIEETGIAQDFRDARIFAIYEGTNGIQAIDLVRRKVGRDGGTAAGAVADEIAATARKVGEVNSASFGRTASQLTAAAENLSAATAYLAEALASGRETDALAGASPYLRLFGLAFGGSLLAQAALAASSQEADGQIGLARFFAETFAGETAALAAAVADGAEGLTQAAAAVL